MKKVKKPNNQMVIFQSKTGAIELKGDFRRETIWATQAQIADIFIVERSVITKHIRNILRDKELDSDSVCAKIAHTAADGKTYQVQAYNLDIILAVGYRTSSKRAIEFRQWATKTLRQYIVDGFAINKNRIAKNYDVFEKALADVKALLPAGSAMDNESVLELIKLFSDTWLSLDAYDKDTLKIKGATKKRVALTSEALQERLAELKIVLMKKGEATELFGAERQREAVAGIVGNVMQSFGGKPVYPTVEEKAAHLLYFMVKNHPFVDGNKRSGAYAFVWFLKMARILDTKRITPPALTALTILVAESNPKDKEKMIRLVLTLLLKGK